VEISQMSDSPRAGRGESRGVETRAARYNDPPPQSVEVGDAPDGAVGRHKDKSRGRRLRFLADLLRELVVRDMRVRYKRSALGVFWALLNPLAQVLVFSFLFQRVLPLGVEDYPSFVLTGVLVWNWFQTALVTASGSIVENKALLLQPGFPPAILPVVTVVTQLVHFLLALLVLLPFLALTGHSLAIPLLALPVLVGVQFMLTLGLAYLFASWHVRLRDTQQALGVFLTLYFYVTPVFYAPSAVPARYQTLYYLNPLVHLVQAYRDVLQHGRWPDPSPLALIALASAVLLVLSGRAFVRASHHFIEEL
jgi:lipopolysaccharide transport system permease protein